MKQTLYILTILILLSSCATIMNQPQKNITVYTTEPSKIIHNKDTLETIDNKTNFSFERKNENSTLVANIDSLTKTFEIEPRNSFMYWSNIVCNYGMCMLVDRKNPKRYSYRQRIYINSTDTIGRYIKYGQANNKGELLLHLSLPHINSFHMSPEAEDTKTNTGFWGLTIGLDYYHSNNQFLNLSISGVSDFFVPVPAVVDIGGEYELMSSRYISLSNSHRLKRFTIGYGLSYARNTWELIYSDRFDPSPPTKDPVKKSNNAFGLIFPTYFQLGKHFNIGVVYRPTFYRPNMIDKYEYEHLISFDFAWKIRLKK